MPKRTPQKSSIHHVFLTRLLSLLMGVLLLSCEKSGDVSQKTQLPVWTNFETGANVKALAFEGDDLWLGLSNGIIRYNTKTPDTHQIYTAGSTQGGLLSNGIYKVDAQGNKWIGTYGGGLTKYDGHQWVTFTPYGGGQTVAYGKDWLIYPAGAGLGDLWVYDSIFDNAGNLWVATWKGASMFDGKTFKTYTTTDGLIDKWVYAIAIDHQGIFWFGTEGGVTRYDGKTWKSFTHANGLGSEVSDPAPPSSYEAPSPHHTTPQKVVAKANPNYVLTIAVDRENRKWLGTWGAGLSRFDGKKWKNYTVRDGLAGNYIHVVAMDPKGILWVGTDGGVSKFDGKTWKTYTTRDGLLNNNVFSVAFDREGHKWFGTWTGLSKLEEP
jgi:ligand-binding sensor domain-containing protein